MEEQQWLHNHPVIQVVVEADFQPLIFVDDAFTVKGISKEYLDLLEQKLDVTFKYSDSTPRFDAVEKIKSGEADLITSLSPTSNNLEYLHFTQSYFNAPAVIIVRDSEGFVSDLSKLSGKNVAVTKGYESEEYVRKNYPAVKMVYESNNKEALYDLIFGNVDAAVMNISSASYLAPYLKLSGLKAVGYAGFDYQFSFATSKDNIILRDILYKGLSSITPEEKKEIYDNWISIKIEPVKNSLSASGFSVINPYFIMGWLLLLVFVASIFKEVFISPVKRPPRKSK